VVSWGILIPIGILSARYTCPFESTYLSWFYLHKFCQTSGYVLGVAGLATGLHLGSYSKGIVYSQHRNIGIVIFVFGTLQVIYIESLCQKFIYRVCVSKCPIILSLEKNAQE